MIDKNHVTVYHGGDSEEADRVGGWSLAGKIILVASIVLTLSAAIVLILQ